MLSKTTNITSIYELILKSKSKANKLLAILLDPDKIEWKSVAMLISRINDSPATHVFVGGSLVTTPRIDELVSLLKKDCLLPVVLFPGNPSQISVLADGILFLTLISGRNPDYLIGHHVDAVPVLKQSRLEIIPTAYILIESGHQTAVASISNTVPLDRTNIEYVVQTAQAGELLGSRLVYLEAGSGAQNPVPLTMIKAVSDNISIPLIVGGGIISLKDIDRAYQAGADLVVIGTAFENNIDFFKN